MLQRVALGKPSTSAGAMLPILEPGKSSHSRRSPSLSQRCLFPAPLTGTLELAVNGLVEQAAAVLEGVGTASD